MTTNAKHGSYTEPVYKVLGERIRWVRRQKNISGRQLALAMPGGGSHQTTVTSWEGGKTRLKVADLVRIAAALDVPLVQFVQILLSDIRLEDCAPAPEMREIRSRIGKKRAATLKGKPRKAKQRSGS